MDMRNLEQPLNAEERYLYEINVRLNILIEMFSSFLDVYAKQNQVATTSNEVVEMEDEIENELIEIDESETDYSSLTKAEIIKILEHKEIEFNSRMTKSELIKLLE